MLESLSNYSWPGNIRELFAFLESYLILLENRTSNQALFLKLLGDWISDEFSAANTVASSSNERLSFRTNRLYKKSKFEGTTRMYPSATRAACSG